MKRLITILFIALCTVVALGSYVYLRRPPWGQAIRPLYWRSIYLIGRADGCGWEDATQPLNATLMPLAGQEQRRLVEINRDGFLRQYQTSLGEFWSPEGTSLNLMIAEQLMDLYQQSGSVIRRGDIVVDVGANIGVFSRRALEQGAELVVAVEPSPAPLAALRRNLAHSVDAGRAIIVSKAAWHEPDTMQMAVQNDSVLDSFIMRQDWHGARFVDVPMVALDEELRSLGVEHVDFIKMDIEGAERRALAGLSETIRRDRPRLAIATEHLPDDIDVLPSLILEMVPHYRQHNGACRALSLFLMRPEVVYFSLLESRKQ